MAPALAQPASDPETEATELLFNGDPSDDGRARELFEASAEAGSAEALNGLATIYMQGLGVPIDLPRGRDLLERAAARGSIGANLSLSEYYLDGVAGYPQDPERGYSYAVAAAEAASNPRNAAWAQWRVGMMTLQGVGTPPDEQAAYQWIALAADNGAVRGMVSRAVMLATGQGVAADPSAARVWYARAGQSGELGSAHAMRALGAMIATGEGGAADLAEGYAYLLLAHEGGDEMAQRILDRLRPQIDVSAEVRAQQIKTAWLLAHPPPRPDRDGSRLN